MNEKYSAPKGTRDFAPGSLEVKNKIISIIEKVYSLYGFKAWDGPCFENIETLTKKSGDEIKSQIYNFIDKGNRELGLRFDLTTSLARIIANNNNLKRPIKTYNVGKAFRYENPQAGRYREFFQMDADIFGCANNAAECELLLMIDEVLTNVGFEEFIIELNDRALLIEMVRYAGIGDDLNADVVRVIDKYAKIGKEGVYAELDKLGIEVEKADRVFELISIDGSNEEKLNYFIDKFSGNEKALSILNNLKEILSKVSNENVSKKIVFTPSLVRGHDYYTGTIFEYIVVGGANVGAVGGGGRYDTYVESFGGLPTPAIGCSFGIERLIDWINNNEEMKEKLLGESKAVFVSNFDDANFNNAANLVSYLRKNGVSACYDLNNRKYNKQFTYACDCGFGYFVTVGEDEMKSGVFSVKQLKTKAEQKLTKEQIVELLTK